MYQLPQINRKSLQNQIQIKFKSIKVNTTNNNNSINSNKSSYISVITNTVSRLKLHVIRCNHI